MEKQVKLLSERLFKKNYYDAVLYNTLRTTIYKLVGEDENNVVKIIGECRYLNDNELEFVQYVTADETTLYIQTYTTSGLFNPLSYGVLLADEIAEKIINGEYEIVKVDFDELLEK